MKEHKFLDIITKTLTKKSYIGDDCAYLEDLGLVVTQDSLVEGIHFSRDFSTPYQIGYKSIAVNLSDVFASGAVPKYVTISLSLPSDIGESFIKDFYLACEDLCRKYDIEVVGGDITGGDKVFVSVCAMGVTGGRKISSRANAVVGDYIIVSGEHGSSAAGLWLLSNSGDSVGLSEQEQSILINTHLLPLPQEALSKSVSATISRDYAMMDSSDGLADALVKIAQSSKVSMSIEFEKIPYDKNIQKVAEIANIGFKDWILYGGEDYQIVACVSEKDLKELNSDLYTIIGQVVDKKEDYDVCVYYENGVKDFLDLEKTYNHFKKKDS